MSVPRRFDRRPPERDSTRINDRIRVPEVRLIDDEGNQVGVMKTADALAFAQERELDLVEVAPEARPPVCRVLDYSKYKYEQAQKQKQARKHQQQITVREIKFRPKIAQHDYDTKKQHVERFLRHKDKVKVTIMFRGREQSRPELGFRLLQRLAADVEELGFVESQPRQDGRNMIMVIGPHRRKSEARAERATRDSHHGERGGSRARAADVAAANVAIDDQPVAPPQPADGAQPAAEAQPVPEAQPAPVAQAAPPAQPKPAPVAQAAPPAQPKPAPAAQAAAPAPSAPPKPAPPRPSAPKPAPPKPGPRPPAQSRPKPEAPKPKPPTRPKPEAVAAQARAAASRAAAPETGADS